MMKIISVTPTIPLFLLSAIIIQRLRSTEAFAFHNQHLRIKTKNLKHPPFPLRSSALGDGIILDSSNEPFCKDTSSSLCDEIKKETIGAELWLDLRGTAISPRAALDHLRNLEISEAEKVLQVDRVIISEEHEDIARRGWIQCDNDPDIFVVREIPSDADTPFLTLNEFETDRKQGEVICISDGSSLDNPMRSIDSFEGQKSAGGWVVIDSTGIKDPVERGDAVSNLVDLMSVVMTTNDATLGAKGIEEAPSDSNMSRLGITCGTKADLLRVGASFKAFGWRRSFTTLTDGILVPSDSMDELTENRDRSNHIKTALILPFDIMLWKSSQFVFSNEFID